MVKVSIIVPVYNVEKFLPRCLDSLVNQTLEDIEIICVNDGSSDNSLNILNEYAQKDSRIKVITQENKKKGAARNNGLKIARGEYIGFVDSHDYVDLDFFEKLYNTSKKNNCDIACATIVRKREKSSKYRVYYNSEKIYTKLDEKIKICDVPNCCYVWNKLYKKDLISNKFFPSNTFFEDVLWLPNIIKEAKEIITVADTQYYYVVRDISIVKKLGDKQKQNDAYNSKKYILEYFKDNNLQLQPKYEHISKRTYFFYQIPILKIKEYRNIETFLLFGTIPIFQKKIVNNAFLIFNTAAFGDVLLCNVLVQNIKLLYPTSKIIFIVDKQWQDVAKYQKDVDEVVIYDKYGKHRGFLGFLKFINSFPYKNAVASFITYKNERNYILSKLLGCRKISYRTKKWDLNTSIQYQHASLLQKIGNFDIQNIPMKYELPMNIVNTLHENVLKKNKLNIVICPISKVITKNMPLEYVFNIINKLNTQDYNIILTGIGAKAEKYAKELIKSKCCFTNLVGKTSILELAYLLKNCDCLVSVDTGTMHLGYSIGTKTICIFFETNTKKLWGPDEQIYSNVRVLQNPREVDVLNIVREVCNVE